MINRKGHKLFKIYLKALLQLKLNVNLNFKTLFFIEGFGCDNMTCLIVFLKH